MKALLSGLFVCSLGGLLVCAAMAQPSLPVRRALLVGIDTYLGAPPPITQRNWSNLRGTQNDLEALHSLLVGLYGFEERHIRTLQEQEATRAAILEAIETLIAEAQPGDQVLFYFAGHGSQVRNIGSREPDQMDETLVPVDATQGVPDIRDKELRDLFNRLLDRGVGLTVILDNCHSGSGVRGVLPGAARTITPDPHQQVNDPSDPPAPEDREALVLTATQEDELALEISDGGQDHGAFTWALVQALRRASPQEPVRQLFLRTQAVLRGWGYHQQPRLSPQKPDVLDRPLLGGRQQPSAWTVAVRCERAHALCVDEAQQVALEGGLALGLRPGTRLVRFPSSPAPDTMLLEVVEASMAQATARIVAGKAERLQGGDLFRIASWVASAGGPLRLWRPPALPSQAAVRAAAQAWAALRSLPGITWVDDPTATPISHLVYWDGTGWVLHGALGPAVPLGDTPRAEAIRHALGDTPATVFVTLPAADDLMQALEKEATEQQRSLQWTLRPEEAHYLLTGHLDHAGVPAYAWVRRSATEAVGTSTIPLPARSDWVRPERTLNVAATLADHALKLERIWGWMQLESPPEQQGCFPYQITGFRHLYTRERRLAGDTLRAGEHFAIQVTADPLALHQAVQNPDCPPQYLYVFSIDQAGNSYLQYPRRSEPNLVRLNQNAPLEIVAGRFEVTEPYGVDTYLLLSTDKALPDPAVLEWTGTRLRTEPSQAEIGAHPLLPLLYHVQTGRRSSPPPVPQYWAIQRFPILSAEH